MSALTYSCTKCGSSASDVVDSRLGKNIEGCVAFPHVRRRRRCKKCGFRENTIEIAASQLQKLVSAYLTETARNTPHL